MLEFVTQLSRRHALFAMFVIYILGTSVIEIISELAAGESMSEMTDDLGRLCFGVIVLLVFAYEIWKQHEALGRLRLQLSRTAGRLSEFEPHTAIIGNQYREVMRRQFDTWKLTESEQDVVILMLKGLSFREISHLRETREKTVRQQASTVYRKAGVSGRHELAAWLFEDLLEPPLTQQS